MKQLIKYVVSIIGLMLFMISTSVAEKKFVPIVTDDLLSFASYYTTTNNLQIPAISDANGFKDLVVQCEDDITYFIMASHVFYDNVSLTASSGNIVIEEEGINEAYISYKKGYIEGNESVSITGEVYYGNQLLGDVTKSCNSNIDDSAYPAIPNYPAGANSYGILELNCKDDIIYYTLSYACFKQTVKLSVKADGNPTHEFKDSRQGSNPFIYYEFGYYERGGSTNKVEVVGTITDGNGGGPYSASCP